MTTLTGQAVTEGLHRAAARATLAPSVHNTQPWHFEVHQDRLDLYADSTRLLYSIDSAGRELVLSCGAALFLAKNALLSAQFETHVSLLPDLERPHLMASVQITGSTFVVDRTARRLDAAVIGRHTNRRVYDPRPLPPQVAQALRDAAAAEDAMLYEVAGGQLETVGALTRAAQAEQSVDGFQLHELKSWTGDRDHLLDGVPSAAVPRRSLPVSSGITNREFDLTTAGLLPADPVDGGSLFVLATQGEGVRDWLLAGQALMHVLLEIASAGYVAHPMSQVIEVDRTREQLRERLSLAGMPHLLLRVGLAASTPATPRRHLSAVIDVG